MSGSINASLDPLIRSFSSVPPISVPAIIECVLASSMLPVSNMLSFLLQSFTNFEEANEPNFILCYTNALCHLIKKDCAPADTMNQFFSSFFIPLLKVMNPSNLELLKEIENLVYPLVLETESWDLIDKTLVPFCLGSVGYLRMGTTLEDDIDASKHFTENSSKPLGTLPGKAALRIFISLLDFCLKTWRGLATSNQKILKKFGSLHAFTVNLTRQMSNLALLLLKLSVENRFNAIHLILPSVLGSLNMLSAFKVLEHETQISISQISIYRACFLEKMWSCCHSLFQLGEFERRDAYRILSLYFSSFYDFVGGEKNAEIIDESFDFRGNAVIWEQTKIGLVDRNYSVRKMALYILKSLIDYHSFSVLHGNNQHFFTSQQPTVDAKNVANSLHDGLTKREKWAEKEAKSLGVGEISHSNGICLNGAERWKVFIMLYEMLDEYGTHLVEAAWTHQVSLLFQFWPLNKGSTTSSVYCAPMDTLEGVLCWLTVLWERGFLHENPEVRRLIMHSFLSIDWNIYENHAQKVPKSFILGSLVRGLNDAVHHKGFGLKGIYMSGTIEGASQYFRRISIELSVSERATLAWSLASAVRHESFCRPGLMALAFCISSVACHASPNDKKEKQSWGSSCGVELVDSNVISTVHTSAVELLEALKLVISRSKQQFNSNYRQLVSEQILKAASSLINVHEVSLEVFLHFISVFPREFIDGTGPLRPTLQAWITKRNFEDGKNKIIDCRAYLLKNLLCFPIHFIKHSFTFDDFVSFDDGDIEAWLVEVHRWAWMLFLVIRDENLAPMFELLKSYCCKLCKDSSSDWVPIKLLILLLCLNEESQIVWKKYVFQDETMAGTEPVWRNLDESSIVSSLDASKKITGELLLLVDEVVAYARLVLTKFWSNSIAKDIEISSSVRGKLGGPAQRRFDSSTTTSVLNFIVAMRTIASMVSICSHTKGEVLNSSLAFSWEFAWIAVKIQPYKSEIGSELFLAIYEALAYVLKALSANFGPLDFYLLTDKKSEFPNGDGKPLLDHLFLCFQNGTNDFLANGLLTRSRRAVLLDWKWNCLHSLLSIPCNVLEKGIHREDALPFFSRSIIQDTLIDICDSLEPFLLKICSLETGGENSILFMLRSVKLALGLLYSSKVDPPVSSFNGVNSQIMFQLAKSAWVLHLSCNKRRVAPIAALLSAVLHEPVFGDLKMHEMDANEKGPLKWFIENVIHEGTKSPRTMRLLALHLTGLWLLHPITLKYYIKELKLLSLYGSVAFDEDFEAELRENQDVKIEVSLLAQSPDPELTEVFINTEMYARVSVAVLFYKLYLFIKESKKFEKENFAAVLHCGKTFLLELLDSLVNDSDLSKELYKKFSGVHRRKVRAWQMVCILSHFVEEDIVEKVTFNLHICLYRNNLPAVRQYLETFAIQIYLKFPNLAEEQLIPIFYDYKMRPQALSSYVFIAANVIIHSTELPVQTKHLNNLLPPLIPFLTSHHHSLRCFTQLLVYHVLCKLWPAVRVCKPGFKPLEKRCFEDLRSYLAGNADCVRMRASMEGFLVNFDPVASATPAGIFNSWSEGSDFECVPVSLMDLVMAFLNNVRDELRYSYAMNEETLKNENLSGNGTSDETSSLNELSRNHSLRDSSLDFQKKITLHGYERQASYDNQCFLKSSKISTIFSELEVEDEFFSLAIHERKEVLDKTRESRQQIILVASLLDRIPNLAGLARTCEVFKAACLAIADSSIVEDKQFQLISVTAEKWVPIIEVPINCIKVFLEKKRKEGFSILGLEQTANSTELNKFAFPNKTVLVLGREKEGIPVDIIHDLDGCIEIPQLGVIRSLNVHVSGAIALWEYTRQQRCNQH